MRLGVLVVAGLLAVSPVAHAQPGSWAVKELGTSPGGASYFVASVPSETELVSVSETRQAAKLSVRCDQKGLFITFLWPDYVTAETYDGTRIDVDWKIDKGPVRQARLRKVDQAAVALGKDGFRLLNEMAKGKVLTVHVPDMHGGQETSFPIEGLDALQARVKAQGCG
jgi:hypothetical protein